MGSLALTVPRLIQLLLESMMLPRRLGRSGCPKCAGASARRRVVNGDPGPARASSRVRSRNDSGGSPIAHWAASTIPEAAWPTSIANSGWSASIDMLRSAAMEKTTTRRGRPEISNSVHRAWHSALRADSPTTAPPGEPPEQTESGRLPDVPV